MCISAHTIQTSATIRVPTTPALLSLAESVHLGLDANELLGFASDSAQIRRSANVISGVVLRFLDAVEAGGFRLDPLARSAADPTRTWY